MNSNLVQEDFAAFSAPDPKQAAAEAKIREAQMKKEADLEKKLKPQQMKAAAELTEQMKSEQEAVMKADLIQKLHDYLKLMKEYHPERLEFLRIPKNFGAKNSIEELRVWIRDCETELSKKGGLEFAKVLWVEGFKNLELLSEYTPAKFQGLGQVAELMIRDRQLQDGTIVHGPAIPTLAEFCVYHSNWFQTSVDVRMLLMVGNMLADVHRYNTRREEEGAGPESKPASEKAKKKVDDL